MSDTLTTITTFINSPPGQVVAGAALAGIVWKFFERVEAVLADQTKFEIAVWLVGVNTTRPVESSLSFINSIFDGLFGRKQLTLDCFNRCLITTVTLSVACTLLRPAASLSELVYKLTLLVAITALPIYMEVWAARWFFNMIVEFANRLWFVLLVTYIGFVYLTFFIFGGFFLLYSKFYLNTDGPLSLTDQDVEIVGVGFGFVFVGLCSLAVTSAQVLRLARHFDIGFQWFNRKFDIERHPLSAIGSVAGALVALLYWAWAVFRHFYPA